MRLHDQQAESTILRRSLAVDVNFINRTAINKISMCEWQDGRLQSQLRIAGKIASNIFSINPDNFQEQFISLMYHNSIGVDVFSIVDICDKSFPFDLIRSPIGVIGFQCFTTTFIIVGFLSPMSSLFISSSSPRVVPRAGKFTEWRSIARVGETLFLSRSRESNFLFWQRIVDPWRAAFCRARRKVFWKSNKEQRERGSRGTGTAVSPSGYLNL